MAFKEYAPSVFAALRAAAGLPEAQFLSCLTSAMLSLVTTTATNDTTDEAYSTPAILWGEGRGPRLLSPCGRLVVQVVSRRRARLLRLQVLRRDTEHLAAAAKDNYATSNNKAKTTRYGQRTIL